MNIYDTTIRWYVEHKAADDFRIYTNLVSTGFNKLDYYQDGVLQPGLYTIGAIPSLGKTTLIHQINDNIAASGTDVIYHTLEMPVKMMVEKK